MKLKKLFAGIVAVAMMATMAIPGFAATGGETEAPSTDSPAITVSGKEFTIGKTYTVTGDGIAPDEEFELTQTKASASKTSITDFTTNTAYDLTIGKAKHTNNASGAVTTGFEVTLPSYGNHPGIYTYTLKEKSNGTAGVTYDPNEYTLTVYATQAASENDMTSANSLNYSVRLDVKGAAKGSDNYKLTGLSNTYTSNTIKVTKKVKGNLADRDKTFSFKATFSGTEKMKGSIIADGEAITLTNNEYKFNLKHGQSIEFTNVPTGVTAIVSELNADGRAVAAGELNDTYTVTYDTVAKDNNVEVTVTNDSNEHVDTGVILDNAPYIALLTIVAAGAVVMILKKRRNYED